MKAPLTQGPGKAVGFRVYLHIQALINEDAERRALVDMASERSGVRTGDFNVIRFEEGGAVALLDYPGFMDQAFPVLSRSWRIDPANGRASYRDYRDSLNPPILHRKERLLPAYHPDTPRFAKLTADLESLGLFEDPVRIGYRRQWEALLSERGYRVVGHDLVPIGNYEEDDGDALDADAGAPIVRHLTALSRQTLSAPLAAMTRIGLINETTTFFDYGCGRGDDIAGLLSAGIRAAGWDPYFAPDAPIEPAQIVNIGFVINVIEDPAERREALRRAFALAKTALCVSAMLASDDEVQGRPYADGILTRRNTFQRYYTQTSLRDYIEESLSTTSLALAPGIFLVFKDQAAEQSFHLRRSRSRLRVPHLAKPPKPPRHAKEPKARPTREPKRPRPKPWERCPEAFAALCRQWQELGREPFADEIPHTAALEKAFGSTARALRTVRPRLDQSYIDAVRAQRTEDILVCLALQRFGRRIPYRHLDSGLQRDVKAFLHSYGNATEEAARLLARAAEPGVIEAACTGAAARGLGWLIEGRSLQLHSSLVPRLPPALRIYIGCAAVLYGDVALADLVKIHIASGKVTIMRCDDFSNPLPRITERVKINLRAQDVRYFAYGPSTGFAPPILYLKSRFMHEEMPDYPEQAEFDRRIGACVEIDELLRGPDEDALAAALRREGLKIEAGAVMADDKPPALDDPCGAHLVYRDLIVCGETAMSTGLPNLPRQIDSYRALRALAEKILDPVIEWYGSIELTYGFCSPELSRRIRGRIAPALDQHAAHERNRVGKPICPRLGAAADFLVRDEDMLDVARWVAANIPFDRLYFYGRDRPIHVSYGPEHKRELFEMTATPTGRLMPKPLHLQLP
ncbi:MAG: DNA phosphorothioation-associated putative methyltransferase [Alphaproteobacteria bacterium]|nr:DNA phosphorothioation-associated putative methyltransferase [Alphaproteobacteria bacterium]